MANFFKPILGFIAQAGNVRIKGLPMGLVIVYMLFLLSSLVLYMTGWIYLWYTTGKPDLPKLIDFINSMGSKGFAAVILMVAANFVDRNHNGIPDQLEGGNANVKGDPIPAVPPDDLRHGRGL